MKTTFTFALLVILTMAFAAGRSRTVERRSQQSNRFTALGDLAGGAVFSAAYGVSADGSVVIGRSNSETGMEAFRWTRSSGMVGLGFPEAFAVSDDGAAIAGYRFIPGRTEPVRWTQNGGTQGLGNIAECVGGAARGISADGCVVVGGALRLGFGETAFHWTPKSGIARLPLPNSILGAEANAVSSDGEVVVGAIQHEPGHCTAFRWTSKSGLVDLGALPGDNESMASAVSADGSVVVGVSRSSGKAFRWSEKTGMVDLGALPGGAQSCAFGVSADGSFIVGQADSASGTEAFVWDAAHGMRGVRHLLSREGNRGAELRKWKLRSATAVSRDGSTIVGFGTNPGGNHEAWIARLGTGPLTEKPAMRIATR